MYYKVIYNNKVIDVLDKLVYLKYQAKHNRMVLCKEVEAQAIFSSDREHIWHVEGLYELPIGGYDEVRIIPINQYEYNQLKTLGLQTPEEIIDAFMTTLLEEGII